MFQRERDPFMTTYTGKEFNPTKITYHDVCIEDIAHHLSLLCRWGGAVKRFYSVAQHSIEVSRLCTDDKLEGLLHDASEAYIGDMISPMKLSECGSYFKKIELYVDYVIRSRFKLELRMSDNVKIADEQAWMIEKDNLITWNNSKFLCMSPEEAETEFLKVFHSLTNRI